MNCHTRACNYQCKHSCMKLSMCSHTHSCVLSMHSHSNACNYSCAVTLMHVTIHAQSHSCMQLSMHCHSHACNCPCTVTLISCTQLSMHCHTRACNLSVMHASVHVQSCWCMTHSLCSHTYACTHPCAVRLMYVIFHAQSHSRMQLFMHRHTSMLDVMNRSRHASWSSLWLSNLQFFPLLCQYTFIIPCRAVHPTTKESLI